MQSRVRSDSDADSKSLALTKLSEGDSRFLIYQRRTRIAEAEMYYIMRSGKEAARGRRRKSKTSGQDESHEYGVSAEASRGKVSFYLTRRLLFLGAMILLWQTCSIVRPRTVASSSRWHTAARASTSDFGFEAPTHNYGSAPTVLAWP